jgi:hypothetical protein
MHQLLHTLLQLTGSHHQQHFCIDCLLPCVPPCAPTAYMRKADLSHTAYPLLPNSVPAWSVPLYTLVVPAVLFALHSVVLR